MPHTVEDSCLRLDTMYYERCVMRLSLGLLGYALSRKTEVSIRSCPKLASSSGPWDGVLAPGKGFGRPVLATIESFGGGSAASRLGHSMSGRVVVLDSIVLENLYAAGSLASDALYLCAGSPPETWLEKRPSPKQTMIFAPSETAGELLNLVQDIFDQFDGWESNLTRALLEGGGFQAMLEATDSVMFHPLALQDNNFHLVAFSNMAREQRILDYFENGRSLAPEVVGNMVRGGAYARIVGNQGPYMFDLREVRGIAINLRHQGNFEGFLLVNVPEMDDALLAYYGDVLTVLGGYVGKLLDDRGRFESHWMTSNNLRKLFAAGLRGDPLDPTSWSKALIDSGWTAETDTLVLCIGAHNSDDGTIGYLKKTVDQRWPHAATVLQGERLAVLTTEEELSREFESNKSELNSILHELRIYIGMSRPLRNCRGIETAFKEAEMAMSLAPIWNGFDALTRFEDVAIKALISKATETLPVESLCDESLIKLAKIDEASKTNYLGTIKAYLDNRLNAAAAARALNIQRSTLFYRFNRIKELTGLDIEKARLEQLVLIALSIWMLNR